jgi:hypothetical protein
MTTSLKAPGRFEWLAAGLITLAILWLHIHFWLGAGGLWRDEVNTLNLARTHSLAGMSHDSFPVLMPLLLSAWDGLGLGASDRELRFLGLLCGLMLPAAFWMVARASGRPPLFSLVFFGLNALLICYGDSLRAYGLGSALITLTVAATWGLLSRPSWWRAGVLALAAILSVQTLFQNSILFLAVCLGGFSVCARRKDLATAVKILCAGLVAAVSLLPYYSSFVGLPKASVELRRGFSPFVAELNYEMATGFPFEQYATLWKALAIIVAGLAVVSLFRKRETATAAGMDLSLFAGVTLISVVALFIAFLWFAAVTSRPWYFLPPLALVAVCFDCGLGQALKAGLVKMAGLGFVLGTALISVPQAHQDLRAHFTNIDHATGQLETRLAAGDYILVTPWFTGITFNHYFRGPTNDWDTLPPLTDHTAHRYDLVLEQMLQTNSLEPVMEKMTATLRNGHRVWVVGNLPEWHTNDAPPQPLPAAPLPGSGWSDTPYNGSWAKRTGDFLHRHSELFRESPVFSDGAPNIQENSILYMAEGWRE